MATTWRRSLLHGIAAAALAATSLFTVASAASGEAYTKSAGAQVSAPVYNQADIVPGLVNENSTQYALFGGGTGTVTPKGTNPVTWFRYSGPDIDHLTQQPNADASAFTQVNGDDHYWLANIWVNPNDHAWYGLVHVEYDYYSNSWSAPHLRRIQLAKSTDQGKTWSNLGNILSPDTAYVPPVPNAFDLGEGDQRLVIDPDDGYFYLFYWTGYIILNSASPGSSTLRPHMEVARCPISAGMVPGCWTKWYNGSFSQPGLGGHDGQIMNFNVPIVADPGPDGFDYNDVPTMTYDSYLHKFVAVGRNWMSASTNLGAETWTLPQAFPDTGTCNYRWAFDPATRDPYTMGENWRYYAAGFVCGNKPYYVPESFGALPGSTNAWYASNGYSTGTHQWTSQYSTDHEATVHDMTWDGHALRWSGPVTGCADASATSQQPATGCDAIRTWRAPDADTVTIGAATALSVPAGCTANVSILDNGTQIWPSSGTVTISAGTPYAFPSGVSATVATGDQVRFVASGSGCPVTWDPTLTPSSGTSGQASTGYGVSDSQWRYEYSTDNEATFHDMTWTPSRAAWVGTEPYCLVFSATNQHPGSAGCDSARAWTAPYPATVTIGANGPITVPAGCLGNTSGVNIRIYKNGAQIWPASGSVNIPNGASYTFPAGVTTTVATGDQIQFVDSKAGTTNNCDGMTWDPSVVQTQSATAWQASQDYSVSDGHWGYEYSTDNEASFQNMTWTPSRAAWVGTETYCLVFSRNQQHPGSAGCDSARVWTAPFAGTVTLGANGPITVPAGCSGNTSGVNIRIYKNGAQIWPASGSVNIPNGGSYTFPSSVTATVNTGDQIQFVDAKAGTANSCDGMTWDQSVTPSGGPSWYASNGFSYGPQQWQFEYSTDNEATLHAMTWDTATNAWRGPDYYCAVFAANQQLPGSSGCDSARVWNAPNAATVSLGANGPISVSGGCLGNTSGVDIRILKNGTQIWPTSGTVNIPNGGSYGFPSGVTTAVISGDQIQFVETKAGTTNYCDGTTWDQTVTTV